MNITLDEFVIMPDHFHAIIIIGENQYNTNYDMSNDCGATMHSGSTGDSTMIHKNQFQNRFGPQLKNLASVVRGIKSIVSTYARKTKQDFQWQTKFHDHII
jgi:putative transposase